MKLSKTPTEHLPFTGVVFSPQGQSNGNSCLPAVIVLPGSDGGIPELIAEQIATRGYTTLALGYFGLEGLPPLLENIPLEYFKKPIEWMRKQCKKKSLVILGYSRGAELALLLATIYPDLIDGLIGVSPSSLVVGGFPHPNIPAWLLNNQPVAPYLQGIMNSNDDLEESRELELACKAVIAFHENTESDPYDVVDLFDLRNESDEEAASEIAVEKMKCPLLLLSGEEDKIWPSYKYGKWILERLDEQNSTIKRQHICFPKAGHGLLAPYKGSIYHPIGKFWCRLGGTPEGNALASKKSWEAIFQFLDQLL